MSTVAPTTIDRTEIKTGTAVASVQHQTVIDWELTVVDDGSTDDTAQVIQPYLSDGRVHYVPQTHQGRSAARNHGAELAQGEWLAFLDSDDCYPPAALAAHQTALGQQPAVAMTLGGYEYAGDDGHRLGERRPWEESGLTLADWLFNCLGMPGSFVIRRDWFQQVQGFDASLDMAEDWDLFLRLAQAGCPMGWTRAMVCQYRQHPGSSIHNLTQHRDCALRALEKVFQPAGLAAEIAVLAPRAKAWVHVVFAQRAFAAGQPENAAQDLQQALDLDPTLVGEHRRHLLEILFRPQAVNQKAEIDMEAAVTPYLPAALKHRPADIRAAQARAHMAAFFQTQGYAADGQAQAHLSAALRRDPRWLLNRGVLAYCLRQTLGWVRPGQAPG